MNLSRHATTLAVALLLSSIAPKIYAQMRVAVVDLQRAMNETEDGRRAKAQLKRLFNQRQEALDKKQNDLKLLKEDIEKQKNVLSKAALEKRLDEYQKAFIDLQSTYVEYQRELAEKEGDLTKQIVARMERILRHIGQSEGYTLILERNESGVMWVPGNLDITDNVIQRYNSGEGRDEEGAAAGGGGGGGGGGAGGNKTKKAGGPTKRR